jgi:hypothetical protein
VLYSIDALGSKADPRAWIHKSRGR